MMGFEVWSVRDCSTSGVEGTKRVLGSCLERKKNFFGGKAPQKSFCGYKDISNFLPQISIEISKNIQKCPENIQLLQVLEFSNSELGEHHTSCFLFYNALMP